jgi:hypothetical protein
MDLNGQKPLQQKLRSGSATLKNTPLTNSLELALK